jgi:hypothetical protein
MSDDVPTMTPHSIGFFSEWYVLIAWPSGYKEKLHGFKNEAHARGWIAKDSAAWLDEKRGPRR